MVSRTAAARPPHRQFPTVDDLVERWCSSDHTSQETGSFTHRGTPGIVILARCGTVVAATAIVTTLPWLLRTVGGA